MTNSPVAESQCNGRVENAIRWIQEKVRVLRHQLESGMKCQVPGDAPIMSGMVRWAAVFFSKYAPGDDGRTPSERIRQEACMVAVAIFGETVLCIPFTNVKRNKGEPAKKISVYLGTNEKDG